MPAEEIVRGYEVERDNFVVISDDELKEAAPEKSAAIEIQEFVNESQYRLSILRSRRGSAHQKQQRSVVRYREQLVRNRRQAERVAGR